MKSYLNLLAVCLLMATFAACTEEAFGPVPSDFPAADSTSVITMRLQGSVTLFTADDGTTRSATDWEWQDGDVLFLQFYNGTERIRGHAVYTKSSDSWNIPSWAGDLKEDGTTDKCEVYFFDGASTSSMTSVTLNDSIGVYADNSAIYYCKNGEVVVTANLYPLSSRVRFKEPDTGNVTSIVVGGITTYTQYDAMTNTLSTTDKIISSDVNTSTGYTHYIYGTFTDTTKRQLIVSNDVNGLYCRFQRSFGDNVLQVGKSGYITIPTEDANKGWAPNPSGTENGHDWVDLGLSVFWSTTNVGATDPSDYGGYYAWGETTEKNDYNWGTYYYCNGRDSTMTKYCTDSIFGTVDNLTTLDLSDDAAHANWGGKWRMPTYDELNDLNTKCTWTWTTQNGHNGYKVTGRNGNSIFLPAAGFFYDTSPESTDVFGGFWSSSLDAANPNSARLIRYNKDEHYMSTLIRRMGRSIRPVMSYDDSDLAPFSEESRTFTITGNGKTVSFTMKPVAAGIFQMGGSDSNAQNDEKPIHIVNLTKKYYICETEVTQALWYAVMGQKPTDDGLSWNSIYGEGDNYPAYYISYQDCISFISKLNSMLNDQLMYGEQFTLPTEAQWEYAARGGNKSGGCLYAGSNTIGEVAWYSSNSSSKTHEVKGKQANELGLYDMSGNVWEWCFDWYSSNYYNCSPSNNPFNSQSSSYRVNRGGSWGHDATLCRVSNRNGYTPINQFSDFGLRLVLQ